MGYRRLQPGQATLLVPGGPRLLRGLLGLVPFLLKQEQLKLEKAKRLLALEEAAKAFRLPPRKL